MTEPKQPKKRIVSKSVYFAYLAGMTALGSASALLWIGGFLCSIPALTCGVLAFFTYGSSLFAELLGGLVTWVIIGTALILGGMLTEKAQKKIEPAFPVIHPNIEQLPAEEMLLRASDEPTEGQEKVLLRAAMEGTETPPEQLLRPGNTRS